MSSILVPSIRRPFINTKQAIVLASRLFGLRIKNESRVKELDSYQDRNFYIQGTLARKNDNISDNLTGEFTLKITNHTDSSDKGTLDAQSSVMLFLSERGIECPVPVPSVFGGAKLMCKVPQEESYGTKSFVNDIKVPDVMSSPPTAVNLIDDIELFHGGTYDPDQHFLCAVRLLTFVSGKLLFDVPWTQELLVNFGKTLGKLNLFLKGFHHSSLDGLQHKWDLVHMPAVENYMEAIAEKRKREIVSLVCKKFETEVLAKLSYLEKQVIHGDVNAHNTLVTKCDGRHFGFIDFGDLTISYRLFEVAVAIMYIINMGDRVTSACIHQAGQVLAGYHSVFQLTELEIELLYVSVAARFCQVLVFGAYSYKYFDPGNEYLLRSAKKGWGNLEGFLEMKKEEILKIWRHELGKVQSENHK